MGIDEKLTKLIEALHELDEVKAFLAMRQEILASPELIALDKQKREAQRALAESINDDVVYARNKAIYIQMQQEYDNHPLIVNYKTLREAVSLLLGQIAEIIDGE